MNEHDFFHFREYDIRLPRQAVHVNSKPIAKLEKERTHSHFGLRVFTTNAGHIVRALLGCVLVGHADEHPISQAKTSNGDMSFAP